jgi:hypothetical protein
VLLLLLLVLPSVLLLLTVSPMLAQMAPLAWRPISPVSRMICSAAGEAGAGRGKPGSPQPLLCAGRTLPLVPSQLPDALGLTLRVGRGD